MVHCHAVRLPRGALLSPRAMCGAGYLAPSLAALAAQVLGEMLAQSSHKGHCVDATFVRGKDSRPYESWQRRQQCGQANSVTDPALFRTDAATPVALPLLATARVGSGDAGRNASVAVSSKPESEGLNPCLNVTPRPTRRALPTPCTPSLRAPLTLCTPRVAQVVLSTSCLLLSVTVCYRV